MERRREIGIERYGTPLQPFNGRDVRRDLFEELLDAYVYSLQAAVEYNSGRYEAMSVHLLQLIHAELRLAPIPAVMAGDSVLFCQPAEHLLAKLGTPSLVSRARILCEIADDNLTKAIIKTFDAKVRDAVHRNEQSAFIDFAVCLPEYELTMVLSARDRCVMLMQEPGMAVKSTGSFTVVGLPSEPSELVHVLDWFKSILQWRESQ